MKKLIFFLIILFYNHSDSQNNNWLIFTKSNSALKGNTILNLVVDSLNSIWIDVVTGDNISEFYVYNLQGLELIEIGYLPKKSVYNRFPTAKEKNIFIDKNNNKWITSYNMESGNYYGGIIKLLNDNSIESQSIMDVYNDALKKYQPKKIFIDSKNNVWIIANGTLYKFWGASPKMKIYCDDEIGDINTGTYGFNEDKDGNLWVTGENGKKTTLIKFNGETNQKILETVPLNFLRYSNSGINKIILFIDKNNIKWIGTIESGLFRYDDKNFSNYSLDSNTFPSNYIRAIAQDKKGNIWFGTPEGLVKFDGSSWSVFNVDNSDLLVDNIWSLSVDKNDNVIIGTYGGGLAIFNENGISTDNTSAIDINSMKLFIDIFPNPVNNEITISFSNPEFSNSSISIFNSLGIEMKRFNEKELVGQSSISISTEEFPSGVYFCTITNGTNKMTKSFVIIR